MFIDFGIKDIIDILFVAYLLYYVYKLMKDSGSLNVFYGILVFIAIWVAVSQVFEMRLLGAIFDKLVSVGVLALIILFQEDIRRFFLTIGSQRKSKLWTRLFSKRKDKTLNGENPNVMKIVWACEQMGKGKVGALIIIERTMSLIDIVKTGETIDANINTRLMLNIFFKNSPLHDGAMVISHDRILAAGCILPVSHDLNIPKELGLRHRAALGITQQSDAVAIVVSEETGGISMARKGQFQLRMTSGELESALSSILE